jgi:hypothetical protein
MCRAVRAASLALLLAACASKPSDLAPSSVSPMQYGAYSCAQLVDEAQRVWAHATAAAGARDSQASKGGAETTTVIWPASFLGVDDKRTAAEFARLKGEMEAIEQTSIRKKCGIQFR